MPRPSNSWKFYKYLSLRGLRNPEETAREFDNDLAGHETTTATGEEPDLDKVPFIEKHGAEDWQAPEEPRSKWDLLVLTIPFFSLQLTWSVQQVFGIPYLLSLGIPEAQIPLLVISGPVAGIVVPPIVVALSEAIESPLGKRKPFIFAGGCGTILSFLILAAAEPIGFTLSNAILGSVSSETAAKATYAIAGLSIYALNFFIQPLALGLRASVVDYFSPSQQSDANLWISRFSSAGSIFVALLGLGYSPDFRILSIVVAAFIAMMLVLVALTENTGPPGSGLQTNQRWGTIYAHSVRILSVARRLPPITRWTCQVQIVSWVAWFFVLNYTSVLVSRMYENPEGSHNGIESSMATWVDPGKAVAGVALLFHTVSLLSLVLVSGVWESPSSSIHPSPKENAYDAEAQAMMNGFDSATEKAEAESDNKEGRSSEAKSTASEMSSGNTSPGGMEVYIFRHRDLLARRVWRPALFVLAASVTSTTIIRSVAPQASSSITAISILLGANGALFGLSNWVPYTLIAYEAAARARSRLIRAGKENAPTAAWRESFDYDSDLDEDGAEDIHEEDGEETEDHTDDTPILLTVHQMAITMPQVIAGIVSSLLMQYLDVLGVEQGVWWAFALSVPAAVWAACL
ncbi:hypothetical protein F4861DRAFT_546130 [Xylaria intraflava]|nr:hypothetical protein F4861DRAFT_546130 [Xylaria intraflava]